MSRLLFIVVLLVALVVVLGNLLEGQEEEEQRESDVGKIRVRRIPKPSHKKKIRPKKRFNKQKDVVCPSAELKGIEKCCKVPPGEFFKKEDHTQCVGKKTDPYMARWLTMLQYNKLINTTTKQYSYVDFKMRKFVYPAAIAANCLFTKHSALTSTGDISYPEFKEYLRGKLNPAWKDHIVSIVDSCIPVVDKYAAEKVGPPPGMAVPADQLITLNAIVMMQCIFRKYPNYCPTGYTTVQADWKNCLSKNRTLEQCDKNGGRVTVTRVTPAPEK